MEYNIGFIYRYFLFGYTDAEQFKNNMNAYIHFNNRAGNTTIMSLCNVIDVVRTKDGTNKVPRKNSIISEAHEITRFLTKFVILK